MIDLVFYERDLDMSKADLTGHRILLTGSSGTLGHHISLQLQKLPRTHILAVHRRHHEGWPSHPRLRHQIVNFAHKRKLAELFARFKPTCVIHCAADGMIFPQGTWFKLMRFNVDSTLHLVELAAGQSRLPFHPRQHGPRLSQHGPTAGRDRCARQPASLRREQGLG